MNQPPDLVIGLMYLFVHVGGLLATLLVTTGLYRLAQQFGLISKDHEKF